MNLSVGDRFYDPVADAEFTVCEDVRTAGRSVAELDRVSVLIEFDDGERRTVPHERFRARMTYEPVARAEEGQR